MIRGFEFINPKYSSYIHSDFPISLKLPARSSKNSAGYDFYSPLKILIEPGCSCLIWTNVKAFMPEDEVLKIYPRSSLATKKGLILKNIVGIIDSDYYSNETNDGQIGICLYNMSGTNQTIEMGDKIAQGIFQKFLVIDDDYVVNARSGGFGSTGQ